MAVLDEVQSIKEEFYQNPQDIIAQLFGLEKAIVGIYGSSQDPLVSNVARRIFVEKLYQNVKENLLYISLLAQLYGTAESKNVKERAVKLGNEMVAYENKGDDKAAFLNKKFKEAKVRTKTRAKLIPSFETFNNAVRRLEEAHHLLAPIPTLDKRAEIAYHITIYTAWNENRKALLSKLVQGAKTAQHTSESTNVLNFYNLTTTELGFRIERIRQLVGKYKAEKETILASENYPIIALTEVEGEFIVTYLGLEIRH